MTGDLSMTYEELNLMEDLPLFGTARIPKSEVVRSLEAKGKIRIIAVEPFYFVVEASQPHEGAQEPTK
jgi:hypothetical protein